MGPIYISQKKNKKKNNTAPHSRSLSAVASVVDGGGDAHHGGGDEVTRQVVILPARELALEDLHQHEVELHALQAHPGERGKEAEVEHAGDQGTHQLRGADGETC